MKKWWQNPAARVLFGSVAIAMLVLFLITSDSPVPLAGIELVGGIALFGFSIAAGIEPVKSS